MLHYPVKAFLSAYTHNALFKQVKQNFLLHRRKSGANNAPLPDRYQLNVYATRAVAPRALMLLVFAPLRNSWPNTVWY